MKLIFISLFFVFGMQFFVHDGHQAIFNIEQKNNKVALQMYIEEDLIDHFNVGQDCENYEFTIALCAYQYVVEHLEIFIDEEKVSLNLDGSQIDNGTFILNLKGEGLFFDGSKLKIVNNCFYQYDKKFQNRIVLERKGNIKSYRLNKKNNQLILD